MGSFLAYLRCTIKSLRRISDLELALEEALEKPWCTHTAGNESEAAETRVAFACAPFPADWSVRQLFRCTSVTPGKLFTTSSRHMWPREGRVTYVHISLIFPPVLSGPPGSWRRGQRCWLWLKLSGWPAAPGGPHPLPAAIPTCASVPCWGPTGRPGTYKQMFWISHWFFPLTSNCGSAGRSGLHGK